MKQFPLILLAEGHATHNGTAKGLVEYNGRPFLLYQLRRFAQAHGHHAIVVLGQHCADYAKALPWTEQARDGTVEVEGLHVMVVVDEHPEQGQFSSLQAGARVLHGQKITGAFVLPIEVPAPAHEVWSHLRNSLTGDVAACKPEVAGRTGYPILLSHRFLESLLQMPERSALDVQLKILPPAQVRKIPVDDASVLMSLGTHQQWHKFADSEEA